MLYPLQLRLTILFILTFQIINFLFRWRIRTKMHNVQTLSNRKKQKQIPKMYGVPWNCNLTNWKSHNDIRFFKSINTHFRCTYSDLIRLNLNIYNLYYWRLFLWVETPYPHPDVKSLLYSEWEKTPISGIQS